MKVACVCGGFGWIVTRGGVGGCFCRVDVEKSVHSGRLEVALWLSGWLCVDKGYLLDVLLYDPSTVVTLRKQ